MIYKTIASSSLLSLSVPQLSSRSSTTMMTTTTMTATTRNHRRRSLSSITTLNCYFPRRSSIYYFCREKYDRKTTPPTLDAVVQSAPFDPLDWRPWDPPIDGLIATATAGDQSICALIIEQIVWPGSSRSTVCSRRRTIETTVGRGKRQIIGLSISGYISDNRTRRTIEVLRKKYDSRFVRRKSEVGKLNL